MRKVGDEGKRRLSSNLCSERMFVDIYSVNRWTEKELENKPTEILVTSLSDGNLGIFWFLLISFFDSLHVNHSLLC